MNTPVQTTGLSLLVNWANEQDHWVRGLATEVIQSRKGLTDARAKHFYELLLQEKELKKGTSLFVPLLQETGDANDQEDTLTLFKISDVQHVNALATGQELGGNPILS